MFDNPSLFETNIDVKDLIVNQSAAGFMSQFAYSLEIIRNYCSSKRFRDETWNQMAARHALMMEFLKNMSEGDCKPFKHLLSLAFTEVDED